MKLLNETGLRHLIEKIKEMIGKKADTEYVDSKVKTDVPLNAKFTDTIYNHPSTHPYSMITGTPNSLPANGGHSNTSSGLIGDDTRNNDYPPSTYMNGGSRYKSRAGWQTEFKRISTMGVSGFSRTYIYVQTHTPWSDSSGGYPVQVVYGDGTPVWRVGISNTSWGEWEKFNDGGDAKTVTGKAVRTSVPDNAKFTGVISSSTEPVLNTGDEWHKEI